MELNPEKTKTLLEQLEEATEIKPEADNNKSYIWSGGDDKQENPFLNDTTNTQTNSTSTNQKQPEKKLNNEEKLKNQKASAETLTATIDIVFDLLGNIVLNYKFKKNFNFDELEKAKDIQDDLIESLSGEDLVLRNKYDRLNKKRLDKIDELPFDATSTERLNRIFLNYFAITGKEISPEIMLYLGLGVAILEKAETIFTD